MSDTLIKILTLIATVVVLAVVFLPFLITQARDTANKPESAFYCVRCNRGYNEITFAWHQHAMHPGLMIEVVDQERTVGKAQPFVAAPITADVEPEPEPEPEPERGIVEVTSGERVYRLYAGGRK